MKHIYVLGSINQDIVVQANRHPKLGETIHGNALQYFPGGKGANQAIAATRAGAITKMIGMVGDDDFGKNLIHFLSENDVSTDDIGTIKNIPTGAAIITVANSENTIVVIAGANNALQADAVNHIEFSKSDVVVAQFETPVETTTKVFSRVKEKGGTTILNPAPADKVSDELLRLTDYLVVNEHEFEIVFGKSVDIVSEQTNWQEAINSNFNGAIIVTLGSEGAKLWSSNVYIKQDGITVESVDSTGAGDCFVGYFAAGLTQEKTLKDALEYANTAAALSVAKLGAATSIPTAHELTQFDMR